VKKAFYDDNFDHAAVRRSKTTSSEVVSTSPLTEEPSPAMKSGKFLLLTFMDRDGLLPFTYAVAVSFSSAKDMASDHLPSNPNARCLRVLKGGIVTRCSVNVITRSG